MRVLILSHPCARAVNQELFAAVRARSGWEVSIVAPRRWRDDYGSVALERLPDLDGQLIPRRVALAGNVPLHIYLARLGRVLAQVRPDVFFIHHEPYGAATHQAIRACGAHPALLVGIYSSQNLVKDYPWPVSRWERQAYRRAQFAFVLAESVAPVLRAKGFRGPIAELPPPVNLERLEARDDRHGDFLVGYVGRLADEKGVDLLLDALAHPSAGLLRARIVGGGPAGQDLSRRAVAQGVANRVEWVGYVPHDEIARAYIGLDVLAVPSRTRSNWTEQFGRVVIEALAAGVPVLAAESGELGRLIARTGGGWTFPEGDAAALAGALIRLSQDRRELRARAVTGRRYVAGAYGLDAVADRFIETVRDAADAA